MGKMVGPSPLSILPSKIMIEPALTAAVAIISGGFILTGKINSRIDTLDRRIDQVELRVAEQYVSKTDFTQMLERVEQHMSRIEERLDRITIIRNE